MLSAGGALAGVLLAMVGRARARALAPVSLPRLDQIAVDGRVLAFTAAIAVLTSLVFGLVPALRGGAAGAQQDAGGRFARQRRRPLARPIASSSSPTSCSRSCCSPAPA